MTKLTMHLGALGLLLAACDPSGACTPGASVACTGLGGCAGYQSCTADGTRYSICQCERPGPDDGGDRDADGGGTGDAAVPLRDAGTGPDASTVPSDGGIDVGLALRPLPSATASLRFVHAFVTDVKLCVFGADGDPRPYAVIPFASATGDVIFAPAIYDAVPAGIEVSMSVVIGDGSTTTDGCDVAYADTIGTLYEAAHYTAAYRPSPTFSTCASTADTPFFQCDFYPKGSRNTEPETPCASRGVYVLRDGGGTAAIGIRAVNLSENAGTLGFSDTGRGNNQLVDNHFSETALVQVAYYDQSPLHSTAVYRVCPLYLHCEPTIYDAESPGDPYLANAECVYDNADWIVAELDTARLHADKATTVYAFGRAPSLDVSATALNGSRDVRFVVASDVTD